MPKRPHAKYFTRREAYNIAVSAYEAGLRRGEQRAEDIHWNGNANVKGTDAGAFDEWREKHYPNLPAL